jgi:peptide-methionine (S)-S-oxide reductase
MKNILKVGLLNSLLLLAGLAVSAQNKSAAQNLNSKTKKMETITFGSGCFWCTEAIFQQVEGVISATSGYAGGTVPNPTYREVCTGTTGHAEVVQVVYDPAKVKFEDLLEIFWEMHDPTTLNRQGNDEGTQYRSAIFYYTSEQKKLAELYKDKLNKSHAYSKPIVTEITPFTNFYKAENYHQDYFKINGHGPYCQFVIQPKVDKFKKVFKSKMKH